MMAAYHGYPRCARCGKWITDSKAIFDWHGGPYHTGCWTARRLTLWERIARWFLGGSQMWR